jgi:NADH-quinone oxidoreductase subunit N
MSMLPNFLELLPQTVMMVAACLLLLIGRLARVKGLGGPLCLLTLVIAAGCLVRSASEFTAAQPADSSMSAAIVDGSEPQKSAIPATHRPVVQNTRSIALQWFCLGLGFLLTLTAFDAQRSSDISCEFFGLLLASLSGMMLVSIANDLILLFLALELVGVPLYVLLYLSRSEIVSPGAAKKYLWLGVLSTALLLYGFSLVYGLTGSTNLSAIRSVFAASYTPEASGFAVGGGSRLGVAAMVLIFAGLGFRLSIIPFHFGNPDIYQATTAWNAGLLAVVPKAAGFIALIRVLSESMAGFESTGQLIALVLAAVTMTIGNSMALFQSNVRRILAYTTMAHGGFAMIGIAVGFWDAAHPTQSLEAGTSLPGGIFSCIFYLAGSLLATTGFFAILVYLARQKRQIEYVEDLRGLIRSEPLAACCAGVFLLSLAGIPPLPGFWGRLFVLASSLSVRAESSGEFLTGTNPGFLVLGLIAVLNLLMTAAVYMRMMIVMFLESQVSRPQPSGGRPALAAAVLVALLTIAAGLLPGQALGYFRGMEPAPRDGTRSSAGSPRVSRPDFESAAAEQRVSKRGPGREMRLGNDCNEPPSRLLPSDSESPTRSVQDTVRPETGLPGDNTNI